jgi:hypothetical protein
MLKPRDKKIIDALNKFRVMDRDSIGELFFSSLKNPNLAANNVLLRLYRDGLIERSTMFNPFVYFGPETKIKKDSAKINHFLAILNVYKNVDKLGNMDAFLVEPKYMKKGGPEPDIYCEYRKTRFFIEVQRTVYSEKQMDDKLGRYKDLYESSIMRQPFPHILILSDYHYGIDADDYPFKIFQAENFNKFVESLKPKEDSNVIKANVKGVRIQVKKGAI